DGLPGQFAFLAHHRKAAAERVGERRGDKKAARFDTDQQVGPVRPHRLGKPLDRGMPSLGVSEQRRNVVKQDAGLGEIGDRADMLLQVHRYSSGWLNGKLMRDNGFSSDLTGPSGLSSRDF